MKKIYSLLMILLCSNAIYSMGKWRPDEAEVDLYPPISIDKEEEDGTVTHVGTSFKCLECGELWPTYKILAMNCCTHPKKKSKKPKPPSQPTPQHNDQ